MNVIDINEGRSGFLMFGRLDIHSFGVILVISNSAANAEFVINANPICSINSESWSSLVASMVQAKLIELNIIKLNPTNQFYQLCGDSYTGDAYVNWLTPSTQSQFTYKGEVGFIDHYDQHVICVYYGDLKMTLRACPAELRECLISLGYK